MLKRIARVSFLAMLLVGLIAPPSEPGGHGGGGHAGGSWGHGGGHHHGGHHHHGTVVVDVGVGAWGWGWPWWGWPGYPYWPYPYGYYPPVVNELVTYIQGPAPSQGAPQQEAPPPPTAYWYYCPSAHAYYPQTATCDEPWVKVPPRRE